MRPFTRPRRGRGLVDLGRVASPGNKATNLAWLAHRGVSVPRTVVVDSVYAARSLGLAPGKYAVRSSADDEDGDSGAAAGVYLTELDVDADAVPESVGRVLGSALPGGGMAAMIQPMVTPLLSGVSFSRNPVTGLSDVIVEAIEGRGDGLVQDGADALRWVHRNGVFVEEPSESEYRPLIEEVVEHTRTLADDFGPADLEWVWDGSDLHWVQIRPITTIDDVPIYSRRIARDVMPGLIKPLVWSVNVPMVNSAWVRLFTDAIGPNTLEPERLARSFAFRAYFDMRAIGDVFELAGMPRDSLENLLGLPGAQRRMRPGLGSFAKLPRMLWFALRTWSGRRRYGSERKDLHGAFDAYEASRLVDLSAEELLGEIAALVALGERVAYTNIVVPLLANLHTKTLKKALGRVGINLEDHPPAVRSEFDPGPLLNQLGNTLSAVDGGTRERILTGDLTLLGDGTRALLEEAIARFGYLSESTNDISAPHWREDRTRVLRIALASRGDLSPGSEPLESVVSRVRGRRGRRVRRALARASRFTGLRDEVSATYAYGYGLLRPRFLEVGQRLVVRGLLDHATDVFLLTRSEAEDALTGHVADYRGTARSVEQSMSEAEDLLMPDMIVGDEWLPEPLEVVERLEGVGASRGRYRGRARWISSLEDAEALEAGDVLVVEYSDVAWTPLFARAGAVVTAAGGILAHSSITAREMGLPCVASVSHARLLDGLTVLVDGSEGLVLVEG